MANPTNSSFVIRNERPADQDEIRQLIRTAFHRHPHHPPGSSAIEHLIVDELRIKGSLTLSMVAVVDQKVIGHVAFSPIRIDGAKSEWFGLGPVAVHPDSQHCGVGTALINKGLEDLHRHGAQGVVVFGNPNFYRRFGFDVDTRMILENVPPEYFLTRSFAGNTSAGVVTYDEAFSITSPDDQA